VNYALTQMEDPVFSAMQEWVIAQGGCTLANLYREIQLYMGVQLQEYEAERTLLIITQKEKESITEYYHRVSALWNLAYTPERARVYKFLTSIRPAISISLLDREFTNVSSVLKSARIVEERRKDLDTNYPRRNGALNQSSSNKQSKNVSTSTNPAQGRSASRTGSHPNDRFGAVARKPNG
jgi:hypothetical protein